MFFFSLFVIGLCSGNASGEIQLSNGKIYKGDIELPSLRIFSSNLKRFVNCRQSNIAMVRTKVISEKMVQAWAFVEESSRKKIYFPEWYPVRQYTTEVFLRSGQLVRGHIVASSFIVFGKDEDHRFVLQQKQKGRKGESLENLVFVKEIRLAGFPGQAHLLNLKGKLPGAEKLFFLRQNETVASSATVSSDGTCIAKDLLPGKYLVLIKGFGKIIHGSLGPKVKAETKKAILSAVGKSREFFLEKRVLALGGNDVVWALVGLKRKGGTSSGNQVFVRYELWRFERLTPRWEVQARVYLFRDRFSPGTHHKWPEAVELGSLSKVVLSGKDSGLPFSKKVNEILKEGDKK